MPKDKYDDAIERLSKLRGAAFRSAVVKEWMYSRDLFQRAGADSQFAYLDGAVVECGCLTQIRSDEHYAAVSRGGPEVDDDLFGHYLSDLTMEIRDDSRIPDSQNTITRRDLPVFAEWQRKIDAMGIR